MRIYYIPNFSLSQGLFGKNLHFATKSSIIKLSLRKKEINIMIYKAVINEEKKDDFFAYLKELHVPEENAVLTNSRSSV